MHANSIVAAKMLRQSIPAHAEQSQTGHTHVIRCSYGDMQWAVLEALDNEPSGVVA